MKPVYVMGRNGKSHFAIRANNRTQQLDNKETQEYIEMHWQRNQKEVF
ncbi:MAG: hypothetical protein HZR80_17460 [Candidatus Heimdallarchaeota archaeon]